MENTKQTFYEKIGGKLLQSLDLRLAKRESGISRKIGEFA
jgi:hypothetical protein